MKTHDRALSMAHPRLIAGGYFCLIAIVGTAILDSLITALIIKEELLPAYITIIIAASLAFCFGALFGEKILHCPRPFGRKTFILGFLMTLSALPFFSLFYLMALTYQHQQAFDGATFIQLFFTYFIVLVQLLLLVGFWVAIFTGLASLYLRGQLSYDLMHTHYQIRNTLSKRRTVKKSNDPYTLHH